MLAQYLSTNAHRWARITLPNLSVWLHQFALLHRSGVDIVRSLEILAAQEPNPRLRLVTEKLQERISADGVQLSSACGLFPNVFPPQVLLLMETGENTGDFAARLAQAAKLLDSQHALESRVRQSLTMPCVTLGVCLALVFVVITLVFPRFLELFVDLHVKLPAITVAVIVIVHILDHPAFGVFVFLLLAGAWWNRQSLKVTVLDMLLYSRLTRKITGQVLATSFCDVMARLYNDGVSLTVGLELLARTSQIKQHARLLRQVNERFKSNGMLTSAVEIIPYFPRVVAAMLVVGEESGELTQSLLAAASLLDTENQDVMNRMVTLIEPFTIFLVGGIMCFFVVGLFLPIYELINVVSP